MEACVLNSLAGSFCDIFFFTQTKAPPASSPRSATGISPCGCIAHTYDTIQVSLLDRLDDVSFVTSTVTIITFVFVTVNSSLTPSVISVITFAFTSHGHHSNLQYDSLTISPTRTIFSPLTRKIPRGMSPYFSPT